jgi:FkbM family methyltransferase
MYSVFRKRTQKLRLGIRGLRKTLLAFLEPRHYLAALNMLRMYEHPFDLYCRYLLGSGIYPAPIGVRTPIGLIHLTVWSWHDILTVNEIFCRHDYQAHSNARVIVDIGSNIGISAAYFLAHCPNAYVYLFEPLPQNVSRLIANLQPFRDRYSLQQVAVGEVLGMVEFGYEETGRYGGIGKQTGKYITLPCIDSNQAVESVLNKHAAIDILKIDIERLEQTVARRIPESFLNSINHIYVESDFIDNPFYRTHVYKQYGAVAQFKRHGM